MRKRQSRDRQGRRGLSQALGSATGAALDRRAFLQRSGLAAAGLAALSLPLSQVRPAAAQSSAGSAARQVRTVCTHCSVGCSVVAEVSNGVWIGQEPAIDSPINLGGHCAKGASVRYHALGERRLKYPMKRVGGEWQRVGWEEAIGEIGDRLLAIREESGPDSVYWLGSAHHGNEQAYLLRKLAAMWGTNNIDQDARLISAGGDAALTQVWGVGAMTNSFNDLRQARSIFVIGGSPAEDQPVSMLHLLRAKERNDAPLIVCDPRFSRTAALADEYVRYRPGTDVALIWGVLREIFRNRWEDREFVRRRVWGLNGIKTEVNKWTPEETERVTGVPPSQLRRIARALGTNRPGTIVWTTPGSQNVLGSNTARALAALQLALGNVGVAGGGANGLRLQDNAQGTSDMGVLCDSLPGYMGLSDRAWKHWARVWRVPYADLVKRFGDDESLMERPGISCSRWFEGALTEAAGIDQPNALRAVMVWGHPVHLTSRLQEVKAALDKLDLVVAVAPHPSMAAVLSEREDGVYLLPSTTQFETEGSVTNASRSVQWRERVMAPMFEALPEQDIIYRLAEKLGLATLVFRNIAVNGDSPEVEDVTREANSGLWTIGYSGHSPERIKLHMRNQSTFDPKTLRAEGGPADGDYYGLPWPCWGLPTARHPGTPTLFDTSRPVAEGGLCFPAAFGPEREGVNLWAEQSFTEGSDIKDGYPEFSMALLKTLNWERELTAEERRAIAEIEGDETDWRTDISGGIQRVALAHGCAPFGNGKARARAWDFPDPVPVHREPLYSNRRDLIESKAAAGKRIYPTYRDRKGFRLPLLFRRVQGTDFAAEYPLILTTGRLAEYDSGGDSTRTIPWLAELRFEMFAEVHPFDANNAGIEDGDPIRLRGPAGTEVVALAMVTRRVGRGVVFMPIHFAGAWLGESLKNRYPEDTDAYVLGDAATTIMGYGYDPVAEMPETLCGLCRIERA